MWYACSEGVGTQPRCARTHPRNWRAVDTRFNERFNERFDAKDEKDEKDG